MNISGVKIEARISRYKYKVRHVKRNEELFKEMRGNLERTD